MRVLINFLVYSNIFVSICALSLTLSTEILLNTSNTQIAQFVFFATLCTYNFQRFFRREKKISSEKSKWVRKNRVSLIITCIFSAVMSLVYFLDFQIKTQITVLFSALICVLYPFYLRNNPYVKIYLISFLWMISTVLLLVFENNILINQDIFFHSLSRLLFVFAIAIPFDIRDLQEDNPSLKTIPFVLGEKKAKMISISALIVLVIISLLQYSSGELKANLLFAIILLSVIASLFIAQSNQKKREIYFSFWIESLSILFFLLLFLFSFIGS